MSRTEARPFIQPIIVTLRCIGTIALVVAPVIASMGLAERDDGVVWHSDNVVLGAN